jgi:hypothetical protein
MGFQENDGYLCCGGRLGGCATGRGLRPLPEIWHEKSPAEAREKIAEGMRSIPDSLRSKQRTLGSKHGKLGSTQQQGMDIAMPARLLLILATPIPGSVHRWKVLGWSIGEEDAVACYWHLLLIHSFLLCVEGALADSPCFGVMPKPGGWRGHSSCRPCRGCSGSHRRSPVPTRS